jgi:hypothetical protein
METAAWPVSDAHRLALQGAVAVVVVTVTMMAVKLRTVVVCVRIVLARTPDGKQGGLFAFALLPG